MRRLIKLILPQILVAKIQNITSYFRDLALSLSAKKNSLASLYYLVISTDFQREQRAVLSGRLEYWSTVENDKESSALLRRNVHRIEKGLIMVPRRDVFAEGFITETVQCYSRLIPSTNLCEDELKWARDVLIEYFNVVKETLIISKAKKNFYKATISKFGAVDLTPTYKPYKFKDLKKVDVTSKQLHDLFTHRRSIRWYQDKYVDRALIEKAVEMASLAPSACNRQPYKFQFSNNNTCVSNVAKCAMGTVGFNDNIPAILVVTGDLSFYPLERDRHVIYIDASLASMQLMLALETIGLSSCPINWPDENENENKITELVKLKPSERVIMLIAVGYADPNGGIPFSQKKKHNVLLKDIE